MITQHVNNDVERSSRRDPRGPNFLGTIARCVRADLRIVFVLHTTRTDINKLVYRSS